MYILLISCTGFVYGHRPRRLDECIHIGTLSRYIHTVIGQAMFGRSKIPRAKGVVLVPPKSPI